MIIGLCGKSGSGKTTLAKELIKQCKHKVVHLDIDKVGHNVLTINEVIIDLINNFGSSIINNGVIDRKKLSSIVFSSKDKMNILENITWKYMEIYIDKFLKENKDNIIILDWILLPKTKYFSMCNIKVLLDIPYEIRKERVINRDNITEFNFELRDSAGIIYNHKDFDYVFDNTNEENIKRLVKRI